MPLMIGAAERTGSRSAALAALAAGLTRRGRLSDSQEVLTPLRSDPLSFVPIAVVASQLLVRPVRAQSIATTAVHDYAVTPAAVDLVRG